MATLGTPLADDRLAKGSLWQLTLDVNGFSHSCGDALATQAHKGRRFQLLAVEPRRLWVQLLEDGYRCWLDRSEIIGQAMACKPWRPRQLSSHAIEQRLPDVLRWSEETEAMPNVYVWGGTLRPNLDCSGLMQLAFASQGIWIPRDAYQQERFCKTIAAGPNNLQLLRPGDLLFFGSTLRCTHVGLYLGQGRYRHSSGREHGRNGIGVDTIFERDDHPVASHYRRDLRGAGRVIRCHDGSHLA
tara:strand:- start:556 stop:1284 length:729 start_codon:yes stop_codon:yes gene_type:complete